MYNNNLKIHFNHEHKIFYVVGTIERYEDITESVVVEGKTYHRFAGRKLVTEQLDFDSVNLEGMKDVKGYALNFLNGDFSSHKVGAYIHSFVSQNNEVSEIHKVLSHFQEQFKIFGFSFGRGRFDGGTRIHNYSFRKGYENTYILCTTLFCYGTDCVFTIEYLLDDFLNADRKLIVESYNKLIDEIEYEASKLKTKKERERYGYDFYHHTLGYPHLVMELNREIGNNWFMLSNEALKTKMITKFHRR